MRFIINSGKIIHETLDGEPVIINLDSGNYYSLDKAGCDIWGLVENGATIDMIIDEIAGRYKGIRTDMENSIRQFLLELQKEDIILSDSAAREEYTPGPDTDNASAPIAGRPDFEAPLLHKYTDMQGLLLLDPIHEVDEAGWPNIKSDLADR